MTRWFENDAFWRRCSSAMFTPQRWADAKEEIEALVALTGVAKGVTVLDLCCGPGRHAAELDRRGFRVTGVDRNPEYLAKARETAPGVEWVEADMREFLREDAYDLALNLYSSFGYFEDRADDIRVLRNVHASLRKGGRFVMEMKGAEPLRRDFQKRFWEEMDDGSLILFDHEVVGDWERLLNKWILLRDGERHEFTLDLRLYDAPSLSAALHEAGFATVDIHGWFDGRPYDDEAKRLVAVATA